MADPTFAALCAAMAGAGWSLDFQEWIPGLTEVESSLKLRRGVSDKDIRDAWPFFAAATLFYLLLITVGPVYMQKRPPSTLSKRLLPFWSLLAWAFSFVACARLGSAILQHIAMARGNETMINGLRNCALHYCLKVDEILAGLHGFPEKLAWLTLFCYSKAFEFIDTVFLVVSKKPVSRLHMIHHLVTMWFAWLNLALFASPGLVFAFINALVHTIMYCWYFLASIKMKPKGLAIVVTGLQNLQMIAGVLVPSYFYSIRKECGIPDVYWASTVGMYTLYIFLFGNLFFTKYCIRSEEEANGEARKVDAAVPKDEEVKTG